MVNPNLNSNSQQPPQQSHPSLPYQPPPQYPSAFQPRAQPSQPTLPTSSASPSSSTSRTATTTATSFHHYNPHPQPHPHSSASSTTSSTSQPSASRHQITAPFQVPRMPMSWPWPTAPVNAQGQMPGHSWVERSAEANANANIDPSLLGERRGGHAGSGWPNSSSG